METDKTNIFSIGLNHETAPVDVRERLAVDPNSYVEISKEFQEFTGADEILVLSTCNRTEFYMSSADQGRGIAWLCDRMGQTAKSPRSYLYVKDGVSVVEHAARVASGLDSMVLGETQIMGQLRDAYRKSQAAELVGYHLHKVFQTAFSIAKEVRSKTEIGLHSISLAAAAVKASNRIFPDLMARNTLFIGAGEMIRLCAEHFSANSISKLTFANRSRKSAGELAGRLGGEVIELDKIDSRLCEFDVVVSCTGSPVPILGKGVVEKALRLRKHSPIAIFDLAVPRDVEEEIQELDDIFLFSIDDLGEMVKLGIENRQSAVSSAEAIISRGLDDYRQWFSTFDTVGTIKALHKFGEDIVDLELRRALSSLKNNEDPTAVIETLARRVKNKILDGPSRALHKANDGDKRAFADTLRKIYDLGS